MIDNAENNETLSRRERERAQHRTDIMNAAIDVFGEKGFFTATLDEIAQRAEFSKGTLYLYFQNKEDLLYTILKESFENWSVIATDILNSGRTLREEITEIFVVSATYLFEQPRLFALMNAQHGSLFKALSEENRETLRELHNSVWSLITERVVLAVENNEIRQVHAKAVSGMFHGAIDNMTLTSWSCETKDCLLEAIEVFMDIIFNGIALERSGI